MKKKKAKKGGGTKKEEKTEAAAESSKKEVVAETEPEPEKAAVEEKVVEDEKPQGDTGPDDKVGSKDGEEAVSELNDSKSHQRQTSLSIQSKMRSSSFRHSTGPISPNLVFSPEENTAPDIYRKQAARIEELEKENKRLGKEVSDGERRWKKAEDELEDLREAEGDDPKSSTTRTGSSAEVEKLKGELISLQRQNAQLQARSRHSSSPSISNTQTSDLESALRSKTTTIESMEIELSTLRAQLERISSGTSLEREQIAALEDKLARSERAAETAQRELGDLKRNLERTTEKAVKEGSERTSAETRVRTLEKEREESKKRAGEAEKKAEGLEKKVEALTQLHRENDSRAQGVRREREGLEREVAELKSKLSKLEEENGKLKSEKEKWKKREEGGADDDAVEEMEDEERQKLEKRVRELESEVHDLRKGVYDRERVRMEGGDELGSPTRFTDVDLGGGSYLNGSNRRSVHTGGGGKGFSDLLASGFNAITGAGGNANGADAGLLEDEGEMDFDEDAFRRAQEEEAKRRLERVKEVKRSLRNWESWRLDLVEERRAVVEGVGEIFEI